MASSSTARPGTSGQRRHAGSNGAKARGAGNGHAAKERSGSADGGTGHAGDSGFKLPAMPSVTMPSMAVPGGTPGKVLWWGGLAAVAAFGIVDWPVAALVAAGTWVAEQHAKQAVQSQNAARAS